MDWFLYDGDLRHERVKVTVVLSIIMQTSTLVSGANITILITPFHGTEREQWYQTG